MSKITVHTARDTIVTHEGLNASRIDGDGYLVLSNQFDDPSKLTAVYAPGKWDRVEIELSDEDIQKAGDEDSSDDDKSKKKKNK